MPTELTEIKTSIQDLDVKVNRLLSWAQGDAELGTPSMREQLEEIRRESIENRKRTYNNRNDIIHVKRDIAENKKEIDTIKKASGLVGAGAGGLVYGIIEFVKSFFV